MRRISPQSVFSSVLLLDSPLLQPCEHSLYFPDLEQWHYEEERYLREMDEVHLVVILGMWQVGERLKWGGRATQTWGLGWGARDAWTWHEVYRGRAGSDRHSEVQLGPGVLDAYGCPTQLRISWGRIPFSVGNQGTQHSGLWKLIHKPEWNWPK